MSIFDLSQLSVIDLLREHDAILDELNKRKVIRSRNNPTGDYAEWLAKEVLGLSLAQNSAKGFDATCADGSRVQIKGRHVSANSKSVQMGVLRNLEGKDFDYLIAIIFEPNWEVRAVVRIPHAAVPSVATYRGHVNGHVMHINDAVLMDESVENITYLFR